MLTGRPGECGLQRVADELRAAAYAVTIVPVEAPLQDGELPRLAEGASSRAAILLQSSEQGCTAAIYVVDTDRGESTLRRLPARPVDAPSAESLLALRVVEIVNATLLELEREQPARKPQTSAAKSLAPMETKLHGEMAVSAGLRGVWLSDAGAAFVGPELGARWSSSTSWYLEAGGFFSASGHGVEAAAGTARVRLLAASFGGGHAFLVLPRLTLALGISASFVGAWATATPAEGYRDIQTFSRSAAFLGAAELRLGLSRSVAAWASVGSGYLVPRIQMAMAAVPSQELGPWLAQGGVGLRAEWEP